MSPKKNDTTAHGLEPGTTLIDGERRDEMTMAAETAKQISCC